MFARVTTVMGSPERGEEEITDFRENVVPFVRAEGGKGAILLVDRETGKGIGITLWESAEAMQASEERANQLRANVAGAMAPTAPPAVERYEVAVFET